MRESVRINEYMKDENVELLNSKEEYFGLKTIRTRGGSRVVQINYIIVQILLRLMR